MQGNLLVKTNLLPLPCLYVLETTILFKEKITLLPLVFIYTINMVDARIVLLNWATHNGNL